MRCWGEGNSERRGDFGDVILYFVSELCPVVRARLSFLSCRKFFGQAQLETSIAAQTDDVFSFFAEDRPWGLIVGVWECGDVDPVFFRLS